ncbi:MAG: hypothetical protein AAGA37_09230 [Actinomycetota bacterium]
MTMTEVLDGFGRFLDERVAGTVGPTVPTAATDLPAVTLTLAAIERALTSIGSRPSPSRTGALSVARSIDLTDASVDFPDGESVQLLSDDRRTLHLPFGPAVAAGGEDVATLANADLSVEIDGAAVTVVAETPAAGQVRGEPARGQLTFGSPLPATGTLTLRYFIGEWEVETARFQGDLVVIAADTDAAGAHALSRSVITELDAATPTSLTGLFGIHPLAAGAVIPIPGLATAHQRELTYRFDFEVERIALGSGGGVIRSIEVDSVVDHANELSDPEEFEVPA